MKILMLNRPDVFERPGGDTVQMMKTKEQLQKRGVIVDISTNFKTSNIDEYDIVHIFNVTRISESYLQYKYAKSKGKKIALSTIYHSKEQLDECEKKAFMGLPKIIKRLLRRSDLLEILKATLRVIKYPSYIMGIIYQIRYGYSELQKKVILGADLILPNSQMELCAISKELQIEIDNNKVSIIPNAVELYDKKQEVKESIFKEKYQVQDFILCVGRIEPLKNQLNIIKALQNSDYELVFAGNLNNKHKKYCKQFLNEVAKNKKIHYVGQLEKSMLYSAYRNAKVTIIGSWFETTGLVGLEAAQMGSNLVITNRGYTREYYKDYVEYCNPNELKSILSSVEKAFDEKVNQELVESLKKIFNWSNAAKVTEKAYRKILQS